jgi:hypothetical protein
MLLQPERILWWEPAKGQAAEESSSWASGIASVLMVLRFGSSSSLLRQLVEAIQRRSHPLGRFQCDGQLDDKKQVGATRRQIDVLEKLLRPVL